MSDTITIFDTTLRDGEQAPGCSMDADEKMQVAQALVELGVDVIEAGYPIASPGDFDSVQRIARKFGSQSTICSLARCRKEDIDSAWGALQDSEKVRVHLFLATSPIHREFKLKMAEDEIVRRAVESVKYCADMMSKRSDIAIPNIEFSPEDAARTELDFLCQVVEQAIEAGATTINIPDTVGYATPNHYFKVISHLKKHVPNIDRCVISTHCHDDLGMAVANSLAGVEAGARQVECTINGLGERAGNAALEEIVMALKTRGDYYGVGTKIQTTKLCQTSRLVSKMTGMTVQRNKAIVGQNAFAHEAGIHQHGMLQSRSTYEIMRPEDVGYIGESLVLGKHSGRHAFRDRVTKLGYQLDDAAFEKVYQGCTVLADKKKSIYDADLIAIIENQSTHVPETWTLASFHVFGGTGTIPTATVELQQTNGSAEPVILRDAATGDGPIDAVFRALERLTGIKAALTQYEVKGVSGGQDAQGEVLVEIEFDSRMYHGSGLSTDIIEASARAYLQALNKARGGTGGRATAPLKGV